jgi:hypothetical protein
VAGVEYLQNIIEAKKSGATDILWDWLDEDKYFSPQKLCLDKTQYTFIALRFLVLNVVHSRIEEWWIIVLSSLMKNSHPLLFIAFHK